MNPKAAVIRLPKDGGHKPGIASQIKYGHGVSMKRSIADDKPRTDPVQLSNSRAPSRSVEFLGESDEKPFRPADVAKPIRVLIPDYFAYELCAALAKPAKCLVDVVHGEHDAEVA